MGLKTGRALEMFKEVNGTSITEEAEAVMLEPLRRAIEIPLDYPRFGSRRPSKSPVATIARAVASKHMKQHPREVGGPNMGPWVRYYTGGYEGPSFHWCAGFVCTILRQAYQIANSRFTGKPIIGNPFSFTLSCDNLAMQAKETGLFLAYPEDLHLPKKGWIFLLRKAHDDWIHTGFVSRVYETCFETIEGNATDILGWEGYKVCKRVRSVNTCDYIRYPEGH
jgi:hypothetical protein